MVAVASQRIQRGVAATISVTFTDQDGEPVDATGTVTVDITTADGTSVVIDGATTHPTDTGVYRAGLTAAQTADLNWLICDWSDGASLRATTVVEVVGGFYFSASEVKRHRSYGSAISRFDAATIHELRRFIEDEFESITGAAWVPRYWFGAVPVRGGRLPLPVRNVRAVRSVWANGVPWTLNELAGIDATDADFGLTWWENTTYSIGLEHGTDGPPSEIREAAIVRLVDLLQSGASPQSLREQRFILDNGTVVELASMGARKTGVPFVDKVLDGFSQQSARLAAG